MNAQADGAQPGDRQHVEILRLEFECLQSIPGGINEVRLWWDPILGCHRVGKRIDISGIEHDDVLPEAATLQMIDHPNILKIVAAAGVDGYPMPMQVIELVTPYLERGSITDALLRGEHFTVTESIGIIQATLRGLAELHDVHGIAHRDVKSGNILLSSDHTRAKVADLGLAGLFDSNGEVPALNNPTLYSPPELALTGLLNRSSDVFSVGLVLRELIGGHFPYSDYSTAMIQERLLKGWLPVRVADLSLPVWTPKSLRRIIAKATNAIPSRRFQSAREMDDALARAMVADWMQIEDGIWEAPFVHLPNRRIRVSSRATRSGEVRMSTLVNRGSGWRRIVSDVEVPQLECAAARGVFDHATSRANVR
ncbi:protein kinase domain-containing protein [Intrasporangium chromatireducens]|uniref:protein kinase domain-containing protein n=1 Tax=Intrasporangium chromatireducens TaxID=1386088 RepID=UPI001969A9CC|nr:protein kinase [Intrasporangium chromatireducens]